MEKENNSDESDSSENEIPDLNSLKPFKFEPKTNIGHIISSSSDDEEEGAEYKVFIKYKELLELTLSCTRLLKLRLNFWCERDTSGVCYHLFQGRS